MTDAKELTMTETIGGGRPVRFCPVCKTADDHPRHVVEDGGDVNVARHMDCCRDVGCPDGSCDVVLADAGEVTGRELLAHLQQLDPHRTARGLAEFQAERPELLERFVAGSPSITLEGTQ